jgi:hypothetical protein
VRYSRHMPAKHRMMANELPDHKFGWMIRWDPLQPDREIRREFKALCTCRWVGELWSRSKRMAQAEWESHMVEAHKQGRFDDV